MGDWINAPKDISNCYGFVYKITHNSTGYYYIGKKFFWSKITKPPLKGKKRKRRSIVESDWKDYWGSSDALQRFLNLYGKENFTREIIELCDSKWDCAYKELKHQMDRQVLFDEYSFNGIINVRLGVKKKKLLQEVKKNGIRRNGKKRIRKSDGDK